jgi:PPK2 family polyphosphate:nucleotide phosphotransferase
VDYRKKFVVEPGSKVRLERIDPSYTGKLDNEDNAQPHINKDLERLRDLQQKLYAEHRRALLVVLQGLDASGKDGTVGHVFSGLNPLGASAHAFKEPTADEQAHDFLWRVHKVTPAHGHVGIFNRSHYEDVLVARVHELVPKEMWSKRYERINEFEKNLAQSGTRIVKCFLHISPEEQLRRFERRLTDRKKQWKISEADYTERACWDDYVQAYEDALERCSTERAPWYVVPADHKWFRNFAVARIVADTLEEMDTQIPPPSVDLAEIRRKYHEAAG